MTTYTCSAAGRLLSTAGLNPLSFSYDRRGNETAKGTSSFGYDSANHLTSANSGGTTSTYSYNGEGVRVGKTVGGATTTYLQDVVGGLPKVLLETTAGQETLFVYGTGLAWEVRPDGTHRYYHADSLGSTRVVTDDTGNPVSAYSYDAYGAVRASAGEVRSFTYTGEQTDDYTKFVYLRARYLDPETGRFLSRDSTLPNPASTQGTNRYSYVQGNPTVHVDPSGRCFEDGCVAEIAIAVFLIQNAPQIRQEIQIIAPYATNFVQQAGPQLVALADRLHTVVQPGQVVPQSCQIAIRGASEPFRRVLTAADLGIPADKLAELEGTYSLQGSQAVVRVDLIRAVGMEGTENLRVNPFTIIENLSKVARADGASVLRIEGTPANPRLLEALARRYNVVTKGATESFEIVLR